MYGVELYTAVRLAVVDEGLRHHEAGRRFGIDRRTVEKMLSYSAPPGYRAENPSGRFPQISGLAFTFDARRPPGDRVTSVTVGRAPLEDGKTYTLATNNFLARGGDDYRVFRAGEVLVDSASVTLMAGQLIDHIIGAGTVAPAIKGRITAR